MTFEELMLIDKLEKEIRKIETRGNDSDYYVLVRRFDVLETIKDILGGMDNEICSR